MKQKQTPYQPDNAVTKDYLGFEPKSKVQYEYFQGCHNYQLE